MNNNDIFRYLSHQYADNAKNKPTQVTLNNGSLITGNFFMCNQDGELMLENKWSIIPLNEKQSIPLYGDDILTLKQ